MAGGPGSNIIVALLALGILLVIIGGLVPAQFNGVQVQQIISPSRLTDSFRHTNLQTGDLIVAVNGSSMHSVSNLSQYMELHKAEPDSCRFGATRRSDQ